MVAHLLVRPREPHHQRALQQSLEIQGGVETPGDKLEPRLDPHHLVHRTATFDDPRETGIDGPGDVATGETRLERGGGGQGADGVAQGGKAGDQKTVHRPTNSRTASSSSAGWMAEGVRSRRSAKPRGVNGRKIAGFVGPNTETTGTPTAAAM